MEKYKCTFCGKEINSNEKELASLVVTTNWIKENEQENQQLFCHLECLKKAMNNSNDLYIGD